MGVTIPTIRRDPHYFLPTTDQRYLLFGSDKEEQKKQFIEFFSQEDWEANERLNDEINRIREDIAPSWLEEPLSLDETAKKYIREDLQQVFIDLCTKPVMEYLSRFHFKSELLMSMYAVTDGFSGLNGSFDSPGTGLNFLSHNMCRLPDSDGTWKICVGGMGSVSRIISQKAQEEGARILTDAKVLNVIIEGGRATGVRLVDGRVIHAHTAIASNADIFRLRDMVGKENFPSDFNLKVDNLLTDGTTLKVNLCLKGLPKFTCLPEDKGQHQTTVHILPQDNIIENIKKSYEETQQGILPSFPTIEWYFHTTADPSLMDPENPELHNSALFVQWVPHTLSGGKTWEEEEEKYVKHLLSICDRFAPGTSELVVDTFPLNPQTLERHFGITRGHIQHVDNSYGFDQRVPYALPIEHLYMCGASSHPGGAVIGCAGHNAAMKILKDIQEGKLPKGKK